MKAISFILNRSFRTLLLSVFVLTSLLVPTAQAATDSGSIGLEGKISAPPPTTPAVISLPRDGSTFTSLPITLSGICPDGLLVKIFKNNVFAGSVMCKGGSYSIVIDLFNGQNELISRVFDALDQAGPDSNKVIVFFSPGGSSPTSNPLLTSTFAKRGANPKQELTWPIVLSGGTGPYAISIDWGDGKAPDLISQPFPGTFNIKHIYDSPGVYNILIKASDKNGGVAFLQLVGVANGALSQEQQAAEQAKNNPAAGATKTKILWQPAAIMVPLVLLTFWLGKKYELKMLKKKIEHGDRPF